jgi:hypothetical protein
MERAISEFSGIGVVHTERCRLVRSDCPQQHTCRSLVIRADKENTGILYVDTGNDETRLSLSRGEEATLEMSGISNVYIVGSVDDTFYEWCAECAS